MLSEVTPALLFQVSSPGATLEKLLAASGVGFFDIALVIDQSPRTAIGGRKRYPITVLVEPPPQIGRVADVEPLIGLRLQHVYIVHPAITEP
jgi:hypothetical protein